MIPAKLADRMLLVVRICNCIAIVLCAALLILGSSDGDGGRRRKPLPLAPTGLGPSPSDEIILPLCELCEIRMRETLAGKTRT